MQKIKPSILKSILAVVALIVCFGAVLLVTVFVSGFNSVEGDFKDFQNDVKKTINPEELLKWAVPLINQKDGGYEIPDANFPSFLRTARIRGNLMILIAPIQNGKQNKMLITWSRGGYGYGLIIGNITDETVRENERMYVTNWVPGISFYRGKH
jgi:hypothetical protein